MKPPFTLNSKIVNLTARISEQVGMINVQQSLDLRLRRINQVRTIHATLAIEGNELSESQVTAILDGKRVVAPVKEVQEAKNSITAYEQMADLHPEQSKDLLTSHRCLMLGLIDSAGSYRSGSAGVVKGEELIHIAPPADIVPNHMAELLSWLSESDDHPLIKSCVFHYEFVFIHPFLDGNGRMARLWQSLILSKWQSLFTFLPVENLVHQHQQEYYQAINISTEQTDSAPFIEFMLSMIEQSLSELIEQAPQATPQVAPQVKDMLTQLAGEMSREEIQLACGLKDRKSFTKRYLKPALNQDLIEMTIPDKPRSSLQKYRLTETGKMTKDILKL
ncbi:MAG: Fic family protein [Desulfotalea sp.]